VLLWVLLLAVSFLVSCVDSTQQCCLPPNFKAHYDYLGNLSPIVAYRADMLYSEQYGMRYDCQLWDPKAHLRFAVYFLQEGQRYYLYNSTSGVCYRSTCPGCFMKFCVGGSSPWKFLGTVTIGTQTTEKYQQSLNGGNVINEVIVSNQQGKCLVVNELIEQGIYLESKSRYANGFFTNVGIPGTPWPAGSFMPPPACSSSEAIPMEMADITKMAHVPLIDHLIPKN